MIDLLYSKDEEQDCESNGDSFSKKKMQGKKRKLDPPGDKQTPRVSRWIPTNSFVSVILTVSLLFLGSQRQQDENDERK